MGPKSKFKKVVIVYPPVTTRKWKPPFKPHVATPFKRKPIKRLPEYPHMEKVPHSTLIKIWHRYTVFNKNSLILLGKYSQSDDRFLRHVRGRQGAAACFVAIGLSKVTDMAKWNENSICEILEIGSKLYLQSVMINKSTCSCTSPKEVYNTFFIGDNVIILSVDDDTTYTGTLLREENEPYFKDEIKKVFPKTTYCILEVEGKFMAIWKLQGSYYIFDPNDRNEIGERVHTGLGCATVIKFIEINRMVKFIQNTLAPEGKKVKFTISLMYFKKFFKADLLPPENVQDILPEKKPVQPVRTTCLASKFPSKDDLIAKVGPLPLPPGFQPGKGKKALPEVEIAVENYTDYTTPSYTDLLDEEKLMDKPNLYPVEKPKPPPVTYYDWVIPKKIAILIGGCHQNSGGCTKFEGKQALGNAIAAVGMLRQYKSKFWYPKIIDEILLTGETIYIESRHKFIGDQELNLQNVADTFKLSKKIYKHFIEEATIIGQLNTDKTNVLDLKPALKEFFADFDAAIIRGPILLAVWSEEGKYYMFDPNERDKKGRVIDKEFSVDWPETVVSEPGFACVTWFNTVDDLVNLYMSNLKKEAKREHFYISKIEIKDFFEIPDMWNSYTALKPGKWILRGTYSQNNTRFSAASRNTQCTCIATMAVILSKVMKCCDWDRDTIDDILLEGDSFYNISVDDLKAKNKFVNKQLMLSEVFRTFNYKDKQLNIIVEECIVNGGLNMLTKKDGVPDLKDGFKEFFADNDSGVITSRGLSFAFWKFEDHYFYFDSHARDNEGYSYYGGTACCLRFESLSDMVQVMLANLNPQGVDFYNIGRVDATIWERTAEGTVKPDFYDYTELSAKKGIIRATSYQGDTEKYDTQADKQTIPNLLVALGMTKLLPCNQWNTVVLDQILTLGDQLYADSRLEVIHADLDNSGNWETEEKPVDMDLINLENVFKEITIGVNKIKFRIEPKLEGIFEPERVKRDRNGNVIYQDHELQNLLWKSLESTEGVSADSKHEIIIDSEHITLVIWKEDGIYYVFDPKGKDYEGNFFGRDLWSAKIVILEEGSEMADDFFYGAMSGQGDNTPVSRKMDEPKDNNEDLDEEEEEEEEEEVEIYPQKIDISDAKACAIMFTTFDDIYQHIMENVRPNKRTDNFQIYPIIITSMPEIKQVTNPQDRSMGNWYGFEEIERKKWILRGTIDLRHSTFPEINRGKQYGSMCVSACVYSRLYALPKFKSSTVDYILKYGDKLHTAVRRHRELELRENKIELGLTDTDILIIVGGLEIRPCETLKQFLIGDYHVYLDMRANVVKGDVAAKEKRKEAPVKAAVEEVAAPIPVPQTVDSSLSIPIRMSRSRRLREETRSFRQSRSSMAESDVVSSQCAIATTPSTVTANAPPEKPVTTLKMGINKFFQKYAYGILSVKGICVSFWYIRDFYYLFDPESRGASGLKEWNGSAFIMRFTNIDTMADIISKNLTKDGSNTFRIDAFSIKAKRAHRPAPSIPAVLPLNPKMTAFREINSEKHILRGSFHQDNPKFNLTPNSTGACNAIVALAMAHIHPAETWSKPIVDDVVMNAYRLYKQSIIALGYDFNEWEDKMVLESINKEFKIGVMNVGWGINNEGLQRGILNIKSPDIPNLRKCCEDFFMDFTLGVIQSPPLTVGVWVNKELFYMFDPNPRGPTGILSSGGTACLLLFTTLRDMVDHFLTNVPPRLQREEFTISPVEIITYEEKPKKIPTIKKEDILKVKQIDSLSGYVGDDKDKEVNKKHEKKGKSIPDQKEKSHRDACYCLTKSKVIPHEELVVDESKFSPEDKKIWARGKSAAKKLKELQANEHRLRAEFYVLENGDAIVRAHYSQNAPKFSSLSRNKQGHANALVAIVMSKLHNPKTWSYKNIEIILESGDVLYKDSFMKYRPTNPLLGLRNLMRKFYIFHLKITTVIYKPSIFGDCRYEDLYVGILNFFMQETAGIIVSDRESYAIAIFQKAGYYYMFDPYDRDIKGNVTDNLGCACLMRFKTIENLVEKYLRNTEIDQESESVPRFSVCGVTLEEVQRITK